jgi:hypothetical protein
MAAAVGGLCDRARASFAERARTLADAHSRQEDAYRALLGTHEHDAGRALERVKLETRVAELTKAKEEQETLVQERAQLEAVRDRLRGRQDAAIDAIRAIMRRTCDGLTEANEKKVVVKMEQEADRGAFEALLADILKNKRVEEKVIHALATSFTPSDLFTQIRNKDASVIALRLGSEATAERLLRLMRESRRACEL